MPGSPVDKVSDPPTLQLVIVHSAGLLQGSKRDAARIWDSDLGYVPSVETVRPNGSSVHQPRPQDLHDGSAPVHQRPRRPNVRQGCIPTDNEYIRSLAQ